MRVLMLLTLSVLLVMGGARPTEVESQPISPIAESTPPAHLPATAALVSERTKPSTDASQVYVPSAVVITIDDGCPGADAPGFIRQCSAAVDPWICISFQRPVYWAEGGDALYAATNGTPHCWVGWRPTIVTAGRYLIEVRIPTYLQGRSKTKQARYTVQHADGGTTVPVDQEANAHTWYNLGTFRCSAGTSCNVTIASDTPDDPWRVIDADAARFTLLAPDTPTLYAISNPDGDGNYTVDWSDAVGAADYLLQEDNNVGFSNPTTMRYSSAESQASISGRAAGTWYYRVQASNPSGNSNWSEVRAVTVKPDAPILSDIANPDGDDDYTVAWSDVNAADSYTLQEDTSSSFSSPMTLYTGPATQYDVVNQPGGTWHYRVRASNAGGDSPWSNVATTTVGDAHELDDTCTQASPISTDGLPQSHTFHAPDDADWVWFPVGMGHTYIAETDHVVGGADTTLELYDSCTGEPIHGTSGDTYGPDARLAWTAPATGTLYLKVSNTTLEAYGADVRYELSVREQAAQGVAILVAGHNDQRSLQPNINWVANLAYRTFTAGGLQLKHVYYLNDSWQDLNYDGENDVDADATLANLDYAINDWAANLVDEETALYLYFVDHGGTDAFMLDGSNELLTAEQLDDWLDNLEASTMISTTVVIVEACRSGSFIETPETVSKLGRVIISSTGSRNNAFPSAQGAHFSDAFFTALGSSKKLYTSFEQGRLAVKATGLDQTPWLDDNGDGVADERDGQRTHGLGLVNFFGEEEPVILSVTVQLVDEATGIIAAEVKDDIGVDHDSVWAEIYAPSFVEPVPGDDFETPELNLPRISLQGPDSDHSYRAASTDFGEPGLYRVVVYAKDRAGKMAVPQEILVHIVQVYLPLVLK